MTQTNVSARRPRARKALMMSCASAALATAALWPQAARAQAFQGSITSSTGSVTRTMPSTTTETLTIGTSTATINWSTNPQQGGGPINFLPAGNTATFTSTPGLADYTVLNRILPGNGQPIALNGHVISTLQGTNATGGNVWFFSPGGIVIGATAVFDVGGLLLTTNNVTNFGTTATGFNASFATGADLDTKVQIQNGAQINALQQDSYVAIVAPRIEQGGTVQVNGSAAYVAGQQVSLTMNQGLFDIQVDVGTNDPNGIVHTGTTGGPANATAADNHTIYMVAVPKNQALTMLLSGGQVGFGDAVNAQVQNGQIVLSAGYGISHDQNGNAIVNGLSAGDSIGGQPAGIDITGGKFSSSLQGAATGDVLATGGGGALEFDGNLNLQALGSSLLLAQSGDAITVGGSATISADDFKGFSANSAGTNVDAHGGTAAVESDTGGSIAITGDTLVSAGAFATVNTATNYGGIARGGTASIDANGGNISIGGNTKVAAIASADSRDNGFDGRDSFGGSAQVTASNGGSVNFGGTLEVNADGDGSFSALTSGGTGGSGIGGYAGVTADSNGSINVGGSAIVSATGYGGGILDSSDGTNGTGQGGTVDLAATNGGSIGFASDLGVSARGIGNPYGNPALQAPAQGGQGTGGSVDLLLNGGSIGIGGNAWLGAGGTGSSGQTGGTGRGGSVIAEINGGEGSSQGGNLSVSGSLILDATGAGGAGNDNAQGAGGQGADGYGGYASFFVTPDLAEGATLNVALADVTIDAGASGGAGGNGVTGGNGGNAYAGYNSHGYAGASLSGDGSANFELYGGTAALGNLTVTAAGNGGNGGAGSGGPGGAGGTGQGGDLAIELAGASMTAQDIRLFGQGFGGLGGSGADVGGDGGGGVGGTGVFYVGNGGTLSANTYLGYTNGRGGDAGTGGSASGAGGAGQSGYDNASIDGNASFGGSSDNATGFIVTSYAQGGTGDTGGSATSGSSAIAINGSLTAAGLVQATAQAGGGNGVTTGGSANGGSASIGISGHLTTDSLFIADNAFGGTGASAGGDGSGGSASLSVNGGAATVTTSANLQATGTGGDSSNGSGGFGSGGSVNLFAGGDLAVNGNLNVNVNGTGGNGSSGGSGQGGDIALVADGDGHLGGHHLTLTANGEPGAGGFGGNGGRISVDAAGGAITGDVLSIEADGSDSGGNVSLTSESDFQGNAGSLGFGATNVLADSSDGAGGTIFVASGDTTGIDLGDANLRATGAFGGEIDLLAGMCSECGGEGALAFQSAALGGGGGIAAGNLAMSTSGNITISLNGGDVAASGTLQGDAGQAIVLGDTGMGGAIRAHDIELTGITIDDSASVLGDIINFTSAGDMNVGELTATDQMNLTAGGNLTAGDLVATNALTLNSGGNLETNDLGGQTVAVTATGSTSVGNVLAPGSASFTAGGLATFNGIVNSPTITVTSSDIDVPQGASLGLSGVTNLLTLNAVSNGLPIVIGNGPAAEGQYQLNEDGNIRATSVVINAQGADSSPADVQVFDTNVEGSNTSGGGITNVTLNTGGSVFVDGLVDFNNAGTADSLTINAGHSIEVNTDAGGIQITDSTGKLTGALALTADNIWVASGSVLNQLETDVNFVGRDTALGVSSGAPNQNGFVRAGAITASVADSFLVQNSGTPQLFAGIDTGPGGLSIASTGTTPAVLIVYGRQTNATGTLITNQDFLGSVAVTGTGGFTTDSSVNGCEIGSTNCGKPTFTIDMASILGPLNDNGDDKKKKKDKQGDQGDDGSSADPSLRLINTTPINNAPPITEPVTSGGDVIVGGAPN